MIFELARDVRSEADKYIEEDGIVTLSLKDIDIVVNGHDLEEAKAGLARDLIKHAEDYYREFELYSSAPNRKCHLPYVMEILAAVQSVKRDSFDDVPGYLKTVNRIGIAEGDFKVPEDFDADNDIISEMFRSDNE